MAGPVRLTVEEERALLQQARLGSERAFERLLADALSIALGAARRMMRDDTEAWDVAQDASLKAWLQIGAFRGEARFSTWFYGIVTRQALDRLRQTRRIADDDDAIIEKADERAGPEEHAEQSEFSAVIRDARRSLTPGEEAVFTLHHDEEMKYREIAETLSMPIGTVMSRLHTARLKLREALKPWREAMK